MSVVDIPIEMLTDSFIYEEYDGIDRTHAPNYKEPITIQNARIDHKRAYYRDAEDSGIRYEAKIYCYVDKTHPNIDYVERSRITFNNKEYTIKEVYHTEVAGYGFLLSVYELELI